MTTTPIPPNQYLPLTDYHIAWLDLPDGTTVSVQPRNENISVVYWDASGRWVDHALFKRIPPEAE